MEKCPKCSKLAVDNDQCIACGIVVSKWLKLHSITPPEKTEKRETPRVYPFTPPSEGKKVPMPETPGDMPMKPPDFAFDKDATIPISDLQPGDEPGSPVAKYIEPVPETPQSLDDLPAPEIPSVGDRIAMAAQPMPRQEPPQEANKPKNNKKERPSFLGDNEVDIIKMKKEMKTDWEEYYRNKKKRLLFGSADDQAENTFRLRNILISVGMLIVGFFALDYKFFLRYGLTTEYNLLQPVTALLALLSFIIALAALFTLKPTNIKVTKTEHGRIKVPFHFIHLIEFGLLGLLIMIMAVQPRLEINSKSAFPMYPSGDMREEFLTGKGIGNFIRPVLSPDKSETIYAIHLYGQNAGYIARLDGDNKYQTVVEGIKLSKFRFINSDTILYMNTSGLYRLHVDLQTSRKYSEEDESVRLLENHQITDFDLSLDGSKLIFCSKGDIWLSRRPFDNAENLTNTPDLADLMPSFYPDNTGFLFVTDLVPVKEGVGFMIKPPDEFDYAEGASATKDDHNYQIFTYEIATHKETQITDDAYNYYYPVYSNNMKKIAVVIEVPAIGGSPLQAIISNEKAVILMKPDGKARIRFFPPIEMPLRAMHEMRWYPDGKNILIGINALLQKGVYKITF